MTIAVELTRSVDGPEVKAMLEAGGVEAELEDGGCGLVVRAEDAETVSHLLEAWSAERGLPFMPLQLDGSSFALVPPAG
jgi:hypothetical protein